MLNINLQKLDTSSLSISVIIPSYNGAHKLPNILEALANQTFQDFETVLVIDGSTDNTREVLESRDWNLKDLRLIYQENGGRAVARNAGATVAKGDLLIFFDDDMYPLEHCLNTLLTFQKKCSDCVLVGSQISDPQKMTSDFLQYRLYLESRWLSNPSSKPQQITLENFLFTSAHFLISKESFFQIGGFDERLTDSEDFDLSMKLLQQNVSIYYLHAAKAWHLDFPGIEKYIKRMIEYRKAKKKLLNLYPHYQQMHPASFQFQISSFKQFILYFFQYNQLWAWFFNSKFFKKLLTRSLRFKLYDIIIFGSIQKA